MTESTAIKNDTTVAGTHQSAALRLIRRALTVVALTVAPLLFFWVIGLFSFAAVIDHSAPAFEQERTDAIVVLTGGTGRVETGLDLLVGDMAGQMLISGVYKGVELKELLELWHGDANERDLSCCITLDYSADDTLGNAMETAKWMQDGDYSSIRLVTANYHMPRAALLFRRQMPGIRIIEHPVHPNGVDMHHWWTSKDGRRLVINEYNKYLLTGFGTALTALPAGKTEQDEPAS